MHAVIALTLNALEFGQKSKKNADIAGRNLLRLYVCHNLNNLIILTISIL